MISGSFPAGISLIAYSIRVPLDGSPKQRRKALFPLLELVGGTAGIDEEGIRFSYRQEVSRLRQAHVGEREIAGSIKAKSEESESGTRFMPLAYVEVIRNKAPVIGFDGKIYRYEGGVYSQVYPEEIDQQTIELIGEQVQSSNLDAVRKVLGVSVLSGLTL